MLLAEKNTATFFPLKKLIKAFSHQSEIVEQISAVHLQMVVIKKGMEKKKEKEQMERRDSWEIHVICPKVKWPIVNLLKVSLPKVLWPKVNLPTKAMSWYRELLSLVIFSCAVELGSGRSPLT